MNDDWQAAQHADECARMQRAEEILRAAMFRPITEEEQEVLAYEVGIPRKEKHEPQ